MYTGFRFEDLRVYQEAVKLSSELFTLTSRWPSIYRYSLGEQLNRAGLSIPLNIAEGTSRTGKDFQHFLAIARGSCFECVPILTIALDKKLLTQTEYDSLRLRVYDIAKMLSSLRSKLSK